MGTVVILSLALLLQGVIIAVLAGSVPFLWWRLQRQEAAVEKLDEVLAEILETAGLSPTAKSSANGQEQSRQGAKR